MAKVQIPTVILLLCTLFSTKHLLQHAQAAAVTDPRELKAVRAIAQKWNIESSDAWNLTGDPCTGVANTSSDIANPGIKCDCSFNDGSTCHVTQMKVYALDKKGEIPEEMANLTYLWDLNLAQNYLSGSIPSFLGTLTEMKYLSLGINKFSGPVPRELGNLRNLIVLSFSSNSLNGTLPPELGNLAQLQELRVSRYLGSMAASSRDLRGNGATRAPFILLQVVAPLWPVQPDITGPTDKAL